MDFTVLCVDDDRGVTELLSEALGSEGYRVLTASGGEAALALVATERIDAAVVDLQMPGMSGIDLLRLVKERSPHIEVIILTGHGTIGVAVEAIKRGAHDFIEKPLNIDHLRHRMRNLHQRLLLADENRRLREQLAEKFHPENLVGISPAMRKIYETIDRLRDDESVVLLEGESGTGKEQVARAIHFGGGRSGAMFMPVDCGALAPDLFESELFGHVKGAFTGASRDKAGLLDTAGKGTLFLDEIGEIPPHLQVKLLRLLQEREYRPVGSDRVRRLEARIVSATNKDLANEMREGRFREDLFYRLHVVVIRIPPLRERAEDIPYLVRHFLKQMSTERRPAKDVTPEAMRILMDYGWPGNVRELGNCVEQAIALGVNATIGVDDLPSHLRHSPPAAEGLREITAKAVRRAIEAAGGNKRLAARTLGISATTLYKKIRDLDARDP